jgi:hypothetical protein
MHEYKQVILPSISATSQSKSAHSLNGKIRYVVAAIGEDIGAGFPSSLQSSAWYDEYARFTYQNAASQSFIL